MARSSNADGLQADKMKEREAGDGLKQTTGGEERIENTVLPATILVARGVSTGREAPISSNYIDVPASARDVMLPIYLQQWNFDFNVTEIRKSMRCQKPNGFERKIVNFAFRNHVKR